MGERKVLNKYFPPDFDPKKVPRMKRDPEKQIGVRMMIPFSMQCKTCGEFMYRGKKFNSLKEDCIGEDYLGIKRFRFYIKCVICSQEITFKTDPENGDYELETGASRNFESWTDKQATEKKHKEAREEEEKSDNMKQLENRTLDSKIELEIMDALDEIKAVNRRHETVDTAEVLKASAARREQNAVGLVGKGAGGEPDEDDAIIKSIQFGGSKVRRLADSDGSSEGEGLAAGGGGSAVGGGSARVSATQKQTNGPTKDGGKGLKGTEKKRTASKVLDAEGAHKFKPAHKSGGVASTSAADFDKGGEDEANEGTVAGNASAVKVEAPGVRLVSAIEAQAKREAERAKAAAAGSMGTKIVVKAKRKRDKGDPAAAGGVGNKKRKKHKSKEDKGAGSDKNGDTAAAAPAAAAAAAAAAQAPATSTAGLGGLNLLGSYASSGSDGD